MTLPRKRRPRRVPRATRARPLLVLAAALALAALPARAQAPAAGERGEVGGQVFDRESGDPIEGVTVVLLWPDPGDGSTAPQRVAVTDARGAYRFDPVPPGRYSVTFVKSGYRAAKMTRFEVVPGQLNRADFPLQPTGPATAESVLELEAFVVEAEVVEDIMSELELRMDSDQLLNIMSAEDFSKFAASDVADALKRVSGVNVVEGQFAIIRGLEDRYNSTLYNSAPVPSPDPDRQSVQLDLFPSDVVSNLLVQKTFSADQPSNSSGGSIDIVTHGYPEVFEIGLSAGTGFNENAADRFVDLVERSATGREQSGRDTLESDLGASLGGRLEVLDREVRFKGVYNREIDYETKDGFQESLEPKRALISPNPFLPSSSGDLAFGELGLTAGRFDLTESTRERQTTAFGAAGLDLDAEGLHRIDGSVFYTEKEETTIELKENGYLPGLDYDAIAAATDLDDADFLGADFGQRGVGSLSSWIGTNTRSPGEGPSDGAPWFSSFFASQSFRRERDLRVYQANGEHEIAWVPGLKFSWIGNRARTTQSEEAYAARMFFEPDDPTPPDPSAVPVGIEDLGPGRFASLPDIFFSTNAIEEDQDFWRVDGEYEVEFFDRFRFRLGAGGWWENAKRSVDSSFLLDPRVSTDCIDSTVVSCNGAGTEYAILADDLLTLGKGIFTDGVNRNAEDEFTELLTATNESQRDIEAWYFDAKLTLFDRVDLLAGVRVEQLFIESLNDPFIGNDPDFDCPLLNPPEEAGCRFGSVDIFPTRYLYFDRPDNRALNETISNFGFDPREITFNDEILGLRLPTTPCQIQENFISLPETVDCIDIDGALLQELVNGEVDERKILPAYGFTIRPVEGLALRGAWSRTVARPSFRELAYYVSVEPGTDDLIVGNPQLRLSDVESWDARVEYTWGDLGDLVAFSWFKKSIDDPIEAIVIRDPLNFEESSTASQYQTFFNNPNRATVEGMEFEVRKSFGFVGEGLRRLGVETDALDFLQYLSIGGNYTYIDAEVKRSAAEIERSVGFFDVTDDEAARFTELEESRRLFSQPEWILNADVSFDHPDWGTKFTLAYFAISDVLAAAGTAAIGQSGNVRSFTLDRYVDSFEQLDFVFSQKISMDRMLPSEWTVPGSWTFKVSVKNLLDGERGRIYDDAQTRREFDERSYRVGRDYSFSLRYEMTF